MIDCFFQVVEIRLLHTRDRRLEPRQRATKGSRLLAKFEAKLVHPVPNPSRAPVDSTERQIEGCFATYRPLSDRAASFSAAVG